jgi:hypothetical protein
MPSSEVLKQMAAYNKHPVLSLTGEILASTAAAGGGSSGSSTAAIIALPGHQDVELSVLAKSCCCCNKTEGDEVGWGLKLMERRHKRQVLWLLLIGLFV